MKISIRNSIKNKIKKALYVLGYEVHRPGYYNLFESLLNYRLKMTDRFFFIQIGANDGIQNDDIYSFVTQNNVEGIVVEPIREYFDDLVCNYKDFPKIKTANFAIHASMKTMKIYKANVDSTFSEDHKGSDLPPWIKGIASFDANHHQRLGIPSKYITHEIVDCISYQELIETFNITKIDMLVIDTEGYDHEIIKMIDFNIKPMIIRFEHGLTHKVMNWENFNEVIKLLIYNGYLINIEFNDAVAYLPEGLSGNIESDPYQHWMRRMGLSNRVD
ncbi:MAG: FkbM family methyltransferase [Smithellaceae bacterium]